MKFLSYHYIKGGYRNFIQGIKNFWFYRKVIYRDRWWDHSFFLDIIERKLQNLDENWDQSIAYFKDDVHDEIKNLLDIIREIKHYQEQIEESDATDEFPYLSHDAAATRVGVLFDKFGKALFCTRDFHIKTIHEMHGCDIIKENGTYRGNLFDHLWD